MDVGLFRLLGILCIIPGMLFFMFVAGYHPREVGDEFWYASAVYSIFFWMYIFCAFH